MHIADGVLPAWVSLSGWGVTAVGLGLSLRRLPVEEIPRLSLVTAAIFLGSLIHIPLGPTSVHLVLNGLAGLLLGPMAFLAFFVALTLQALLFQFGGLFSLGLNTLLMGGPAFLVGVLSHQYGLFRGLGGSALAGGGAVLLSGFLLALALTTAGEDFGTVARLALVAHLPVAVVEGLITALTIKSLRILRPALLPASLLLVLFLPSFSSAHRLDMDVFLEENRIRVEAFFPDGTPARGDQVKMFYGDKLIATCTTNQEGLCFLPRPDYPQVDIVIVGKLGHRVTRTLTISSAPPASPPSSPQTASSGSHKEKLPMNAILSGLGFIFGLGGFILAWDTRRRLERLASSRN